MRRFWCWLRGAHVFEFIVDDDGAIMSEPICARCGYDHGGSRELLEQVQDAGRKLGVA